MPSAWPAASYEQWSATCDTVHAHTQVLGKLAVLLAPPEPQLQHAALRLTARGWETSPLAAPDGSGAFVAALDLRSHEALVEHSDGRGRRVALAPDRPVGEVTRAVLDAVRELAGEVAIEPDPAGGGVDGAARSGRGALQLRPRSGQRVLRGRHAGRAGARGLPGAVPGRSTQVNAWWGSFDLAVNLFSGDSADPPSGDFIMRNAMDSQEVAIGWWPGDPRYGKAAFYAYAHPAPDGFTEAHLQVGRWDGQLGEYVLDWDDVRASPDPHAVALDFAHAAFRHACAVCEWDPALAATAEGTPPPVN